MCVEDQDNWDNYVKQVLGTYRGVRTSQQENHHSFWSMEEMETNYSNHSPDS